MPAIRQLASWQLPRRDFHPLAIEPLAGHTEIRARMVTSGGGHGREGTQEAMGYIPLLVVCAAFFGPAAAVVAWLRRRNPTLWLAYGAVLGPLALAILWIAPPGVCSRCGTTTVGWLEVCDVCGANVRLGQDPIRPVGRQAPTLPVASAGVLAAPTRQAITGPYGSSSARQGTNGVPAEVGHSVGHAVAETSAADSGVMLAFAVYLGGTEALLPGAFYVLARRVTRLQVLGPAHLSPNRLQVEADLADLDFSALNGRLLISAREPTNRRFVLAFEAPAGASVEQLRSAKAAVRTTFDEPDERDVPS